MLCVQKHVFHLYIKGFLKKERPILTKDIFMVDKMSPEHPINRIRQWTNPTQRNIEISDKRLAEWKPNRDRICASQNLTQHRLFLLFTFIEFGGKSQVQRLLRQWNYTDDLNEV